MHDKEEYIIHIRNLKEALNHELFLKKVHGITKFNKKDWLKLCIDMWKDLRKKVKKTKLMNNVVYWKILENVTTEKGRNYLVPKPNYQTSNSFSENILAIEMRKAQILMNKPVYLGLSILELSKIVSMSFGYNYVKPKYDKKSKLCYMDT